MNVWFIRQNGHTKHNDPHRPVDYVPGEPPEYPETEFDYTNEALRQGFARLGWPNVGDLRDGGSGRLAPQSYSLDTVSRVHQEYLEAFSSIRPGDLVLIPATKPYDVYLGRVLCADGSDPGNGSAYFYLHDVENRKPYECAHRVRVLWQRGEDGAVLDYHIPELKGGPWRSAFSRVAKGRDRVLLIARRIGLIPFAEEP